MVTNKAHRENRIQLKAPDKALMAFNYVFVSLSNYYEYLKTPWMIIPRRLNVEAYEYVFRNASSEAGVGFNGASARQPNAREGGIAEEIIRARLGEGKTWQQALEALCAAEKNLTVMTGWFVCGAETENGAIRAIEAQNVMDNRRIRIHGRQFINTACPTFDTDMTNPSLLNLATKIPRTLATDYVLEAFDGERWHELARVAGNNLRHRFHRFAPIAAERVRVTIFDSGDHKTARLFEIRLYHE